MKKIALALITATFALGSVNALAASEAQKAQQEKMKSCNADAKAKNLSGPARKDFMKSCLSGGEAAPGAAAPNAQCEEKAMGKNGKPLAGAAKGAFMKKCQAEAAAAK